MKDIFKVFDDYVNNYDLNNKDIKLKYNHSYRVMKLSEKYSKLLGYSDEDIKIATIIGLFHDIGRFEQLKVYKTYDDSKSINHALLGSKILFEENLIEKITDNKDDYEIIKFAIENHNKLEIEKTNNKRALMHAKLIRDTDKLDIIFLEGYLDETKIRSTKDEISKVVMDSFMKHESILYEYRKNRNDSIAVYFSYAFDINNDITLEELKQNYTYFYKIMDTNNKFKEIYEEVVRYIDERIGKNVRY